VKGQQAEIRKQIVYQQVMVDNEDIPGVKPAVMLVIKTAPEEGTVSPAAILGIAADLGPELRRKGDVALFARLRLRQPLAEPYIELAASAVLPFPFQTDIVVLPLENPE